MLINLSRFVSCTKGKSGGSVFSSNKSGVSIQNKSHKKKTNKGINTITKNTLIRLQNEWLQLSQFLRDDWIRAGKLNKAFNACGVPYRLSGQNLYIQLNFNRSLILSPSISVPPIKPIFPPLTLTITILDSTIPKFEIDWQQIPFDNTFTTLIYTTVPISTGKSKNYKSFKLTSNTAGFATGLIDITNVYRTAHGFIWNKGNNISLKYLQLHELSGYTNQGRIINKLST